LIAVALGAATASGCAGIPPEFEKTCDEELAKIPIKELARFDPYANRVHDGGNTEKISKLIRKALARARDRMQLPRSTVYPWSGVKEPRIWGNYQNKRLARNVAHYIPEEWRKGVEKQIRKKGWAIRQVGPTKEGRNHGEYTVPVKFLVFYRYWGKSFAFEDYYVAWSFTIKGRPPVKAQPKPAPAAPAPAADTRECPFCAETIKAKAILCKHCKSDLREQQ
jgi:hypothetical protein